jgi:hypothetical protein
MGIAHMARTVVTPTEATNALLSIAGTAPQDVDVRLAELYYTDEIRGPETTVVYTRQTPAHSCRLVGRVTAEDVRPLVESDPEVGISGSHGFCDGALQDAGWLFTDTGLTDPLDRDRRSTRVSLVRSFRA